MPFHFAAGLALEINSENAVWTLTGISIGLVYGWWTGHEDRIVSDMVHCGVLGGMLMCLISDFVIPRMAVRVFRVSYLTNGIEEETLSPMNCESQVKSGAIEGMVMGAILGCVIGLLDTVLALFNNDGRGVYFFDRLIGSILQGGSLGLLVGTIFSVIKYC